jgi:hypothetical protein
VKNSKGFTVVEMMVGAVVLTIVLILTTAFFRTQTKFGGQLVKDTGTRESINTALMLIKRDIMQAGIGLSETHQLAFWPSAGANRAYHDLYVSCGRFMSSIVLGDHPFSYSVFNDQASFTAASPLVLPNVLPEDIYGIMTYNATTKARAVIPTTGTVVGALTSFAFTGTTGVLPYTPVIRWSLVDPTDTNKNSIPPYATTQPELQRNGICIAGGALERNLRLQQFGIRCLFTDPNNIDTWVPNSSTTDYDSDFSNQTYDNLKVIEVQLQYQTMKAGENEAKSYNWLPQKTKVMNVVSRNIYIMTNRQMLATD